MMKKFTYIILILLFSLFIIGCSNPEYINLSKKPTNHYYTDELSKLLENKSFKLSAFDTNLYKEIPVSEDDKVILNKFLKSLSAKNFTDKPESLPAKPKYKLLINYENQKYVINVYNENTISIYPFDGVYPEDFIITTDIAKGYQLLPFCKYIFKN